MKKNVMVAALLTLMATAASAQVMVHEHDSKAAYEKQLQILTEKTASTGAYVFVASPPVTGAPYSGEAVTEAVQVLADGNRIVRRTTARVYRDGKGRTRREMLGQDGQVTSVLISDPVRGSSVVFDPNSNTAHRSGVATYVTASDGRVDAAAGSGAVAYYIQADAKRDKELKEKLAAELKAVQETKDKTAQHVSITAQVAGEHGTVTTVGPVTWVSAEHASADAKNIQKEDLGQQVIEGVPAKGSRTTTVIPAGAIGNELPISVTSEEWTSVDLKVLVMTKHSDPRSGETTYRLTGITRGEPDPSLFEAPAGVIIK